MIFEWLLKAGTMILTGLLNMLDVLPSVPESVTTKIDTFFNYLYNASNLFFLFCDKNLVVILVPLVIAIVNFDKVYKIIMWILRKVPFVSIE